ncbi:CFEM domain-containing protein [Microdochium nivale]|nr:CFEM domain-containing protein [Microdochium nivale]
MKCITCLSTLVLLACAVLAVTMPANTTVTIPIENSTTPTCANRCMVDSMYVTQCLDVSCLCHGKDYQQSLLQCLYSQCDSAEYGRALSSTISLCIGTGAVIYMVAPNHYSGELLRSREDDYLEGRQVFDVPGLKLRQESVDVNPPQTATVTLTVLSAAPASFLTVTQTATATTTIALSPTLASPFAPPLRMVNNTDAGAGVDSSFVPWLVTTGGTRSTQPSYVSFVV